MTETEKTHRVLVFANGEFKGSFGWTDERTARAFRHGIKDGAGYYGGDECYAFVVPGDEGDIEEAVEGANLTQQDIDEAMAAEVW